MGKLKTVLTHFNNLKPENDELDVNKQRTVLKQFWNFPNIFLFPKILSVKLVRQLDYKTFKLQTIFNLW